MRWNLETVIENGGLYADDLINEAKEDYRHNEKKSRNRRLLRENVFENREKFENCHSIESRPSDRLKD